MCVCACVCVCVCVCIWVCTLGCELVVTTTLYYGCEKVVHNVGSQRAEYVNIMCTLRCHNVIYQQ